MALNETGFYGGSSGWADIEKFVQEQEATRQINEQARIQNEIARMASEAEKDESEASRVSAESSRSAAEEARSQAESERVQAESARKSAEIARSQAEASRVSAENSRSAAESARDNAEIARESAEAERDKSEVKRVSSENSRSSAEASRVKAESDRVQSEASRVSAESSRSAAEEARSQAEASRADLFESSMAGWQSGVDSLLATGGTYEARISALEAIENTREMTYEQIQAVTTARVASRYLPVGDQLIIPWKYGSYDVQDWAWDVVHHFDGSDADHPLVVTEDGKKRPAIMLMAHTACPQECQLDAKEAFYAADEAMAAGTYTFEVSITVAWGSTGEWAVTGTRSFQFTLSGEAPAGSLLMFSGDPYAAKLDTMSVQVFDGFTAVSASQTCPISSGSDGTSLGTMSNTPNGNLNAYARATYGSNDPKASKTINWLNSADESIVEVAATKWDRQSIMNGKAGFMTGFDPAFLAILGKVKAMVQPHSIDGSELEELYCTFRPISAKEHYFNNYLSATAEGYNAEGTGVVLDYWKNIAAANGRTSPWAGWNTYPELITYDAVSKTTARYVWLLSVYRYVIYSGGVGYVNACGSSGYNAAGGSLRVPPACLIVGDPVEDEAATQEELA